ncbi:hypothetical protein E1H12_16245 [Geitlerinema sp. P-1104]|uniref:hypothetical protein n=1 Tax=Geitlerinema sp. P-1104 TaxID=2546230 RepID=UPI001476E0D8|nr:hypothetical protein [Geitlerinema sp. P-1104]NMG60026.1 hypothetical protein [Geitlerinema sp. P-1104]
MKIFEPGIQSAYNTHKFKEGEKGMKCCSCPRVMTLAEWEEKRKCFCQSRNAVLAVARYSAPTHLQTRHQSLNPQNTRANTSSATARNTHPNSTVTPGGISRSATSHSSDSRVRSSFSGSMAVILALFLGGGLWVVRPHLGTLIKNTPIETTNKNTSIQLTPKQVIAQYYQLATLNTTAALDLLSDEYKASYNHNQGDDSAKSFWNTIQKVEIYAFLTLKKSENKHKIKIWLKYLTVDGYTACESQVIDVVLNRTKNKWLIDKTGNVEQKFNCEQ